MSEQAVHFNCGEDRVYGILHRPDNPNQSSPRRGIIFLSAGSRYRAGPYNLYVHLARKLAQSGITVLRFDLPGIGDSEGVLTETSDYWHRFIEHNEDSSAAISFMQEDVGIEEIGLAGLCGGALIALRTGTVDPRVRFLVLLSLPVDELGDLSEDAAQGLFLRQYLRKALQWKSWRNLLLLRSKFRVMGKVMARIGHIHKQHRLVDESLWQDVRSFTGSKRHLLFAYGESDPLFESFQNTYPHRIARLPRHQRDCCETLVVDGGNHTFTNRDWQQQVTETSISWLARTGDVARQ